MIRIIIQTSDYGAAANIGGPVETSVKSFDIEAPAVEAYLQEYEKDKVEAKAKGQQTWWSRSAVGVEIVQKSS